ncbi:hypothetical protein GCM10025869_05740 [Homoserinibacter gongjuensis]|uniref:Glycosyltransferase subfamily 4-like N-terminal domain-containing protein n=1 Tax=Homoserinibacter gongjuensis TaxID=1162968 RepID=A0ABQ6JP55_9MICO|nr:hypothetical protein GCM10025869_05740 [Homoserinibacter gongjuensis]
MTTLHVTLDELAATPYGGLSRYAGELTRALLATAPEGAEVVGMVPASPEPDYERIGALLPGLARLEKSVLAHRELSAAWRRGLGRPSRTGMLHATSLLAPLGAHDRVHQPGDQVAVTIHDAIAWTAPELLPSRTVSWQHAMAARAERFADAVVVPSHAVAAELAEHLDLGDRIRVIPGAPSSGLIPPRGAGRRAAELGLPEQYLLTVAGTEPKKNLAALLDALPSRGSSCRSWSSPTMRMPSPSWQRRRGWPRGAWWRSAHSPTRTSGSSTCAPTPTCSRARPKASGSR